MTIFEKIVKGDIPAYKIAEDDDYLAFLDVFPIKKAHTLVIPKKATDYIFDLEDKDLVSLHLFAKRVAKAMEKAIDCKRIGVSVIGLEVPHVHIHLVPLDDIGDLDFSNPKLEFSDVEMKEIAQSISNYFI
ncbi:MAG: HIT family protein [Bacteroidia bacterium]|nr:HIT family protein [Bacteroidia bacterium]NNJ54763.1 HIT family protein [Bacteroidia bacterium]